ncbi:MAG: serine kinase [Chloroflexi bacterium]|nr:serine kinase [Chloroflexota bacterium]
MTETNPLAFFESVYDAYQRAEQSAGGVIDRYYTIGDYTVRLQFAGHALVPFITPALEHLAISPDKTRADLTICLWDSASTATSMPPRPWELDDQIVRGEVRAFSNARIHTMLSGDVGAVSMLDETENLGVYWIRDACHVPTYERSAPLRAIIHWWMRQHGRFLVHAGAIGYQECGVLLVGKGGSGKSTSTLASLVHGWRYVGDDYCLLAPNGAPYVYSLYNSAKLNASHLENFPRLLSGISNPEELANEKALLYLHQHQPTSLISGLPVQVILLPRVTGRPETVVAPATPTAALQALGPSSLFQLPGIGQSEFLALADLVRKVPCYHLELGTELERIPQTMMKVLPQ